MLISYFSLSIRGQAQNNLIYARRGHLQKEFPTSLFLLSLFSFVSEIQQMWKDSVLLDSPYVHSQLKKKGKKSGKFQL